MIYVLLISHIDTGHLSHPICAFSDVETGRKYIAESGEILLAGRKDLKLILHLTYFDEDNHK